MSRLQRVGSLDIDQDLQVQKRTWRVQRISWVILLVVVLAALAGLFGAGPLSDATAGTPQGTLWVEYQRFWREGSSYTLRVHLEMPPGSRSARVWISNDYLRKTKLESITPQPIRAEAGEDRTYFEVALAPGQHTAELALQLQANGPGPLTAEIGVDGLGAPVHAKQFFYP